MSVENEIHYERDPSELYHTCYHSPTDSPTEMNDVLIKENYFYTIKIYHQSYDE